MKNQSNIYTENYILIFIAVFKYYYSHLFLDEYSDDLISFIGLECEFELCDHKKLGFVKEAKRHMESSKFQHQLSFT